MTDKVLQSAFVKLKKKDYAGAEALLDTYEKAAKAAGDSEREALALTTRAMSWRLRGDAKKAYKFYQQAERLEPDDLSLKLTAGELLADEFKQFEPAIKKADQILKATQDTTFRHRALNLRGRALLLSGKKAQAKRDLHELCTSDWIKLGSCIAVDFKFIEIAWTKNFEPQLCGVYLAQAHKLAKTKKEVVYTKVIEQLLKMMAAAK